MPGSKRDPLAALLAVVSDEGTDAYDLSVALLGTDAHWADREIARRDRLIAEMGEHQRHLTQTVAAKDGHIAELETYLSSVMDDLQRKLAHIAQLNAYVHDIEAELTAAQQALKAAAPSPRLRPALAAIVLQLRRLARRAKRRIR